jgi:hypothetical protein
MSRALPLAGFQVTLIGRIWVIPEGLTVTWRSNDGKVLNLSFNQCLQFRNHQLMRGRQLVRGHYSGAKPSKATSGQNPFEGVHLK